jgi:hypothetical protein
MRQIEPLYKKKIIKPSILKKKNCKSISLTNLSAKILNKISVNHIQQNLNIADNYTQHQLYIFQVFMNYSERQVSTESQRTQ